MGLFFLPPSHLVVFRLERSPCSILLRVGANAARCKQQYGGLPVRITYQVHTHHLRVPPLP